MEEEYTALLDNNVWGVFPRPLNKKVVSSRRHYVQKLGATGEVVHDKAWFVARDFSQVKGIDYQETFSPVFRYEFFRILIALMATLHTRQWKTKQRDVMNEFHNGSLKEEVLIAQPKRFEKGTNLGLKLKKALYGLKRSHRQRQEV